MLQRLKTHIEDWLLEEQARWLLWIPVAMACGIILFFMQSATPAYYVGIAVTAAGAPAIVFWKRWPWVRAILLMLFFVGVGFMAAQWQQERLRQPLINYPTAVLPIKATLTEVIADETGKQKLVLTDVEVEGGSRYPLPNTIRLSLKKPNNKLLAGQRIKLRGGMFPLPSPALPDGFDFTRHFYFKNIGAVGFAINPVEILSESENKSWQISLANFRKNLNERVAENLNPHFRDNVSAIAGALITGERAGINQETKEAMRTAGLAHMLAISGLHLGLVTAVIFVLLRYIFLFIPKLALHFNIKKWAAVGALIGGMGYLMIAGFPVSAQRAYVMVALVLLAVLLDRQVLPMRSLALAAIMVLLIMPSSVMGPSFQLSFAATMSIIALFESLYRWRRTRGATPVRHYGISRKVMVYLGGVLATTFVASMITSPFTVYHFNQFTNYHLLANMAASPIFSFMVMPAAVGGVLLMPLGWEQPFLWVMGQGVEWVIAIAVSISSLPNAMMHVPTPPTWALALVAFGACWLCFWLKPIRHLGWLIMAVGLVPFFSTQLPDILVSAKAEQIAIKLDSGEYTMFKGSKRNFKAGLWKDALGIEGFAKAELPQQCDATGCIVEYQGYRIAFPKWKEAAYEDCATVDVIISDFYHECNKGIIIERPKQASTLTIKGGEIIFKQAKSFTARLSSRGKPKWKRE